MNISPSSLRPELSQLSRHAVFIAIVLGLCFDGWLLWHSWQQLTDQPLPTDRVIAKQLRVSETQRQTLMNGIITYQHPAATPSIPNITFAPGTAN